MVLDSWVYYLGVPVVCVLLYRYRYRVLFMTIRTVIKMMQLYKQFKNRNIKQNHLQLVTVDKVSDNIVICHYHGYIDQKEHKLKVIKNVLENYDEVVIDHIIDSLDFRNHIVHCSLVTPDTNNILDLTSIIREFVYHFDKDDEWSRMKHFFMYVSDYYDLEGVGLDKNNMYFVVYLNDENFTEVKHKVEDITNHQFKDVLRIGPKREPLV